MSASQMFEMLRTKHPIFHYHSHQFSRKNQIILLKFHFSIENLCEFSPEISFDFRSVPICNDPNSTLAQRLIFLIGLAEIATYWKCVCSPKIQIHCGELSPWEISWWKHLWFQGLGEFFYQNKIQTNHENFVDISCLNPKKRKENFDFVGSNCSIVPVGGGKDSCVTLELLRQMNQPLYGFCVNEQPARLETFVISGGEARHLICARRKIDPNLLARNIEGYWNGHTPFSSVIAFSGTFSSFLVGASELVLSNEASANEPSVFGTEINHQYSKSYEFEKNFSDYLSQLEIPVQYFSLLRPFHELQIARQFSFFPKFFNSFKSCNVGSKENLWCGHCAKCLFVYLILAPFLTEAQLYTIFGKNLLKLPDLKENLLELLGKTTQKPFECVGTVAEARAAFESIKGNSSSVQMLLREFNHDHSVPKKFLPAIERMYACVRNFD